MSRKCDLTDLSGMKINKIAIERSKVTNRNPVKSYPNLQNVTFKTKECGTLRLKIANRTRRTIEKFGGLHGFFQNMKRKNLSQLGLSLRSKFVDEKIFKSKKSESK